jgi:AsmA protein
VRRPAKLAFGCAGVLALAFVAAAIALPFLIDANALRPRAEAELGGLVGRKVTLGRVKISLWSGLALTADSFRVGEPNAGPAAGIPVVEAGPTAVRLAFLPLLHKEVEAKSISIDQASVLQDGKPIVSELKVRSSLRVGADGGMDAAGTIDARVNLLSSRPPVVARFSVRLGQGTLTVEALDAEIAGAKIHARGSIAGVNSPKPKARLDLAVDLGKSTITGPLDLTLGSGTPTGRFDLVAPHLDLAELATFPSKLAGTAAPAIPAGIEMKDVRATMTMAGGELRLDDTAFQAFGGSGRGSVVAHPFEAARSFTVSQKVSGVSIGAVIAALAPAEKGSVEGTAALDLALRGRAGEAALLPTISGPGHVEIRNGSIKSVGVIQQVMKLLEVAGAKGIAKNETPFDRLTADFDVASGVASTKNLEFRSADLDFDGSGTVGLGGALHLDALGSFSKEITGQLVAKTPALSMRVNDAGRLTVPLQIRGTVQAPKVQLDVDKVIREGVTKELKKQGTKNLLKKLFGH